MVKLLDHGYVEYVAHLGSDEDIIRAARMSTDKGFLGWGPLKGCKHCNLGYTANYTSSDDMPLGGWPCIDGKQHDFEGDEKLLRYLYKHKHMTPFEMATVVFEIQAPIFVFREWHRHRTQSYNELSARYTELPDMFYVPSIARLMAGMQATSNKQSSTAGFSREDAEILQADLEHSYRMSRSTYEGLLAQGVSREIARMVIPVSQYSRMRASANLRNWLGFLTLRQDPAAQWEIRQYAHEVHDQLAERFPRTLALFNGK